MGSQSSSSIPASPSKPAALPRRAVQAARLALMAVALYMGWWTYLGYREMLSRPAPESEEVEVGEAALLAPAELLLELPETGSWLVAGLPFQMESFAAAEAELDAALAAPLREGAPETGWPLDEGLKAFFNLLQAEPRQGGEETLYRLDAGERRLAVFTRRDRDKEYILGGRLARRRAGAGWEVIEARANGPGVDPGHARGLLPLPVGSKVLAERQARDGAKLGQVVLLPASMGQARAHWKERGWKVRGVKGWEKNELLVCHREGVTVSAWAMSGKKAGGPTPVLLVRLPEPKGGIVKGD